MSKGVNKVILIGNLGNDPDARYTPAGSAVTNLSIATDESYKDKQTGQMVPKTEWHRVVMFNRLAEIAKEYLKKGSKVYIEGRLQTRKWQDQNGQDRYTTEIVASEMQMLDSRSGGQQAPAPQQGGYQAPAPQQGGYAQQRPAPAPSLQQPGTAYCASGVASSNQPPQAPAPQPGTAAPADDFDDDIPF